jgi:hypothetical protein
MKTRTLVKGLAVAGFVTIQSLSAQADTLAILLDISSSTPIVQPKFIQTTMPMIGDQISKLPIGSQIKVFSVGDDNAVPLAIDMYVQRDKSARGNTAKELAVSVPRDIEKYLNAVRANPSKMQGESSLSPAFLDASKWCKTGKPCQITYLTDGMEYQPGVLAWPVQYKTPLPPIAGLDLKGANVFMFGVGQGVPSQARIAIEQHWTTWLKEHKAGEVDLRRL